MRMSIIVGLYNMEREVKRTLATLAPRFQGIAEDSYEIVLVDNGSATRLDQATLNAVASNASYHYIESAAVSPTNAINDAVATSRGELVMVVIDGARMLSPGVLSRTLQAFQVFDDPFVYAPSFHLGPQLQNDSAYGGYDQSVEDELLASVDWQADGYRLFDVSNVETVPERLALPTFESNCFTVHRNTWEQVGGYHKGFGQSAGGGLANWELFARFMKRTDITPVLLVGEGTFHQYHGGASTNQPRSGHPIRMWLQEYESLIGEPFAWPDYEPVLFGTARSPITDALYTENVRAQIALLDELSLTGEHDAAFTIARRIGERNPNDPGKLQLIAAVLERASRRAEAIAMIDTAIEIAPTQAELHVTRGVILVGLHRLDQAARAYDTAIELDPLLPEAYFHRGHLALRAGATADAINDFERAIAREPSPPDHYLQDLQLARDRRAADTAIMASPTTSSNASAASLVTTFLASVHDHYGRDLDSTAIEQHASEGSFTAADLEQLIQLTRAKQPDRALVVGAFLGLSTRALLDATDETQTTVVAVDPNVRHRAFDVPLGHARRFAASERCDFRAGFFGAHTDGGTLFDLQHFQPSLTESEAVERIAQVSVLPSLGTFDFILIDADGGSELELASHGISHLAPRGTMVISGAHNAAIAQLIIAVGSGSAQTIETPHGHGFTVITSS